MGSPGMMSGIGRRLGRTRIESDAALPVAAPEPTIVEFAAFAEDCRIRGSLHLTTERLSDQLNGEDPLVLSGVFVESLADAQSHDLPELIVQRDELCAVIASGPGGHPARRIRTQTTHVEVELGPYRVEGDLHGTPASNPLRTVLRRAVWVPLTDVTISYSSGAQRVTETVATLLLNRAMATSFRALDLPPYVAPPWERQPTAATSAPPVAAADAPESGS